MSRRVITGEQFKISKLFDKFLQFTNGKIEKRFEAQAMKTRSKLLKKVIVRRNFRFMEIQWLKM